MLKVYHWLHVESGKIGTKTYEELYRGHLIEMCNRWNRQGGGRWKYWVE